MESTVFLEGLQGDIAASRAQVESYRQTLTDAQLSWKPAPDVWSITEILQHLVTTTTLYRRGMDATLAKALERPSGRRASFKARRFAAWFVRMAGPTSEKKLKAPKRFQPNASDVGRETLDAFAVQQDELDSLLRQSADADLNKPRMGSPITPLLRFSLGEALLLIVRHQQRHLQQAERLQAHPAFGSGSG